MTALADPRQDFLAQGMQGPLRDPTLLIDPDQIPQTTWEQLPAGHGSYRGITDVAVGIGVAYLLLSRMVGNQIRIRPSGWRSSYYLGTSTLQASVEHATGKYRNAWTYMLNPAISQAMAMGSTTRLAYPEEIEYATVFSHQIFDYINQTNSQALVAAYEQQLADKWDPDVAWARAVSGYGLEERSMRQYLKMATTGGAKEIIPHAARIFVQRQLEDRAKKLGYNESYRAKELGKTLVWMSHYYKGELPVDTQREWLTAEDERVCKICGPMDHVAVPITEQFELPNGNKIWAPGVHPNCRCSVQLTYPEMVKKAESDETRRRASADQPRTQGRFGNRTTKDLLDATTDFDPTPEQIAGAVARGVITQQEADELTQGAAIKAPEAAPAAVLAPSAPITAPEVQVTPIVAPPASQAVAAPAAVEQTAAPMVQAGVKAPGVAAIQAPSIADVQAPDKVDQRLHTFKPMYIFANDLDQQLVRNGKLVWAGDQEYDVGDKINLDRYGTKGIEVESLPLNRDLAFRASDMYDDLDAFDDWDRSAAYGKSAYHRTAKEFYERAMQPQIMNHIINSLTPDDMAEIFYLNADHVTPHVMPAEDQRERIRIRVKNETDMRNAYLHYVETKIPSKVPGWLELKSLEQQMPKEPHTPQVLVFSGAVKGSYLRDTKHALISGRYRVDETHVIPAKLDMGGDTPSNIQAIQLVYVSLDSPTS